MKKIIDRFPNATELWFIVFIFAVSLFFLVGSFGFRNATSRSFPLFTSISTLLLTLIYVIKLYRSPENAEEKGPLTAEERADAQSSVKKVTMTFICFVGYIVLSHLFGFLVASAVIGLLYPLLHGYRNVLGVAGSLFVNIGIVLLFQKVLGVPLSRGILLDMTYLFY